MLATIDVLFLVFGVAAAYLVGGFVKTAVNRDTIWDRTGDYDLYRVAIIKSIMTGPFGRVG